MQELIFYVNAASTLGICRDSFDAKTVALPAIIRGGEVLFRMRLFSGKCAAFLRAGERPGILTLTAETPGLPPATLTVLAEDGMVSLPALCVG